MKKVFLILVFTMFSCDLLNTRDPEPPEKPRTNFINPTTAEIVFQNFTSSIADKVLENYISCFVDKSFINEDFKFIPSTGSVNQFPILQDWDINSEKQYFTNLISQIEKNQKINLVLSNMEKRVFPDSTLIQYDYFFSVTFPEQTQTYKGVSQFTLRNDSRNFWVITKWLDIKVENFLSWSELKGRMY
ncbi:MAG: hypothetical protein Fur0015_11970 [Ignavibacteriales bacterium]